MMKERQIQLYDLQFCLCEWGDPTNTPILILHGWLDQAAGWKTIAENLRQNNYYVLALDQRGHGKSQHIPTSSSYHFPDYIADVACLQQTLHLPPFVLIGHSMGGTVASQYAALQPNHVKQLIMIEGIGPQHETPKQAYNRYKKHLQQRITPITSKSFDSIEKGIIRLQKAHRYLSNQQARFLVERMSIKTDDGYLWRWDPRHKHLSAIGFDIERHLYLLNQIQAPTHLIFGNKSM